MAFEAADVDEVVAAETQVAAGVPRWPTPTRTPGQAAVAAQAVAAQVVAAQVVVLTGALEAVAEALRTGAPAVAPMAEEIEAEAEGMWQVFTEGKSSCS